MQLPHTYDYMFMKYSFGWNRDVSVSNLNCCRMHFTANQNASCALHLANFRLSFENKGFAMRMSIIRYTVPGKNTYRIDCM